MSYTNFQIGEKFPLPIRQQGEGGLFQVDVNGAMFILQLAKSDIIAIEAFRTGEMELALCEEDGILFLLYRIPGIFKEGWGDAPLSFGSLAAEQRPSEKSLADGRLHLCLVDAARPEGGDDARPLRCAASPPCTGGRRNAAFTRFLRRARAGCLAAHEPRRHAGESRRRLGNPARAQGRAAPLRRCRR